VTELNETEIRKIPFFVIWITLFLVIYAQNIPSFMKTLDEFLISFVLNKFNKRVCCFLFSKLKKIEMEKEQKKAIIISPLSFGNFWNFRNFKSFWSFRNF
jgi:hypothetical protein